MQKDLYEFIIRELRAYRMNKAVSNTLDNESMLGISAQYLSEVPRSVTNKFNSQTENQALNMNPLHELKHDIRRVDIWLEHLDMESPEERYMIYNFYICNRSYNTIISNWNVLYTREYWRKKRICGLNHIVDAINTSQKFKELVGM